MAAHMATRISVRRNISLAKALDRIRAHNKPTSRERFETLLEELYTEVPGAWDGQRGARRRLLLARTAAAKSIVARTRREPSTEAQLAAFANREALLTRAKAARLSPQELEAFELFIERPKLKYREIASRLGMSTSQVGVVKHRIKRKLSA